MASIRKRTSKNGKITYLIRVSIGYENGKPVMVHIPIPQKQKARDARLKWGNPLSIC